MIYDVLSEYDLPIIIIYYFQTYDQYNEIIWLKANEENNFKLQNWNRIGTNSVCGRLIQTFIKYYRKLWTIPMVNIAWRC